jgi:hypothetical protein
MARKKAVKKVEQEKTDLAIKEKPETLEVEETKVEAIEVEETKVEEIEVEEIEVEATEVVQEEKVERVNYREELARFERKVSKMRKAGIVSDDITDERALEGVLSLEDDEKLVAGIKLALSSRGSEKDTIQKQVEYRMGLGVEKLERELSKLHNPVFHGSEKLEVEKSEELDIRLFTLVQSFKVNLRKVILNEGVVVEAGDDIDYISSNGKGRMSNIVWTDHGAVDENKRTLSMRDLKCRLFSDGSYTDADGNVVTYEMRQHRPNGDGIHNTLRVLNGKAFDLFKTHREGSSLYSRICTDADGVEHSQARQGNLASEDLFDISRLITEGFPWMHGTLSRPQA